MNRSRGNTKWATKDIFLLGTWNRTWNLMTIIIQSIHVSKPIERETHNSVNCYELLIAHLKCNEQGCTCWKPFSVALTFMSLVLWEQREREWQHASHLPQLESDKTLNISVTRQRLIKIEMKELPLVPLQHTQVWVSGGKPQASEFYLTPQLVVMCSRAGWRHTYYLYILRKTYSSHESTRDRLNPKWKARWTPTCQPSSSWREDPQRNWYQCHLTGWLLKGISIDGKGLVRQAG